MRHTRVMLRLAMSLALGGCMTGPSDGSSQVETTNQANRENLRGAPERARCATSTSCAPRSQTSC